MNDLQQLTASVQTLITKVESLERSIATIKHIFFWILVAGALSFILPLIGLLFVIPTFIENYTSLLSL